MAITFDHAQRLINITSPQNALSCQELIDAIRAEEATQLGIHDTEIASASGKESLDAGVTVGITVNLLAPWQAKFWAGNYIAKVAGGNLVGGLGGDPIAYSAGVQVLLVQSAASTIVTEGGSVPTVGEIAAEVLNTNMDSGVTLSEANDILMGGIAGKLSGAAGTSIKIRDINDTMDVIEATVDEHGNRTDITVNL